MKCASVIFMFFLSSIAIAQSDNPVYDKALADSLGADEYGMKQYIFVILKAGTADASDKEAVSRVFRGHLENIGRLANEGKLVVAGPLGENEMNYRGIYIFNVKTVEEAQDLLKTDPAVSGNYLDAEIFEWYGSAALGTYIDLHAKIAKTNP